MLMSIVNMMLMRIRLLKRKVFLCELLCGVFLLVDRVLMCNVSNMMMVIR